ncbi:MAG: magnesium/cobalt transporter CorA [Cyclobacteriaceae bacterium]
MKPQDLARPDKLLIGGIKSLNKIGYKLYSNQKTEAKGKAELTFIGKKRVEQVQNQLHAFNANEYEIAEGLEDFGYVETLESSKNHWLNFHGIHDVGVIEKIGNQANLDRLTIRQILDTTQRPKVEEHDHYLFFSIKSVLEDSNGDINIEQLSFVLGHHHIISFQEERGDHFDNIRAKMKEDIGFIRKRECDYLLSQLLDAILDNYFETVDKINEELIALEKEVLKNPSQTTLLSLEDQKRSTQLIKKSLTPFKDALASILNSQTRLINKETLKFYRDLGHSATAAIDEVEATLRTLEGLTNIYFASLSHKMNETMKVLTTVATIFIPLTFIAGIYGMNFEYMPELQYRNGYFVVWGVMGLVTIGMLIYFKKNKWM